MKQWRKRFLGGFVVVVLLLIVGACVLWWVSYGRPSFYGKKMTAAELAKNFTAASGKLVGMQKWAQENQQWQYLTSTPGASTQRVNTDPTTAPATSRTITLSEDELNSVLDKHEKELIDKYGQYISDPYIALYDGRIVLAITLKDADRPLSVHVEPVLDDKGMLLLKIDHLQLGKITVPRGLWGSYLDKLAEQLTPKVEQSRQGARMDPDGLASSDAVASELNRLLLNSLKGKSYDPVLFLPPDPSHMERGYPVKVTDIKINEKGLTLTLVTLTKPEQDQLLARIRAPLGDEPAPPIASTPKHPSGT